MKPSILIIVLLGLHLFLSVGPSICSANDACKDVDVGYLNRHVPLMNATIVEMNAINGICEVVLDYKGRTVPLYVGDDFVLAGNMFRNQKNLTAPRIQAQQDKADAALKTQYEKLIPKLESLVAMEYVPPVQNGKVIYMFTDPLCPACTAAGSKLADLSDRHGTTIKAIMFSVHRERGEQKSIEAICRKFDFRQYLRADWKKGDGGEFCMDGKRLFDTSNRFGRDMGIRGVPFFVTDDGTIIRGGNMKKLEAAVKG